MVRINEAQGASLYNIQKPTAGKVAGEEYVNSVFTNSKPQEVTQQPSASNSTIDPKSPYYQVMIDLGYEESLIKSLDQETVEMLIDNALKEADYTEDLLKALDKDTKLELVKAQIETQKNEAKPQVEDKILTDKQQKQFSQALVALGIDKEQVKNLSQQDLMNVVDHELIKARGYEPQQVKDFNLANKLYKLEELIPNNMPEGTATNQTQNNLFFNRAIGSMINMDLSTGDRKTGFYSYSETNLAKSNAFQPNFVQSMIKPREDQSVSAGLYTQVGTESTLSGIQVEGQMKTGKNSMLSGSVSDSVQTDENTSNLFNAKLTETAKFGNVNFAATGSVMNYNNNDVSMTRVTGSVSGSVPIKPVENNKVWHGGMVYATGEVTHSSTNLDVDGQSFEGSTNLAKGTIGAYYDIGTVVMGDLRVGANVSAFNLSDTDGTQFAGGVYGPLGLNKSFGAIPGYGGWSVVVPSVGFNDISLYKSGEVQVTGALNYSSNGWGINRIAHAIDSDVQKTEKEFVANGAVNAHFSESNSNIGVQGSYAQSQGQTVMDMNAYYQHDFNIGDNTQGRISATVGYGSQMGAYVGGGASFSIGNSNKKRPQP